MKQILEKLKAGRPSGGEVKMPAFLNDLYGDLRDRHLLPLVAVLLVAIVAAPLLLKASDPELSSTHAEASLPEVVPASARLEVVADVPTLRDYRDRLRELVAKDPFKQHFTTPQVDPAQLGPGSATAPVPTYDAGPAPAPVTVSPPAADLPPYVPPPPAAAPTLPPPAPTPPPSSGGGGSGSGDGDPAVRVETKLVSYRMTARLGEPGDMNVRRNIPELTMLPNEKNPVAVFLGVSGNGRKALLLVSSEVTETRGDATCSFRDSRGFGDEICQMVELEPGFPVTFTYGDRDRKFRISINRIERVEESGRAGSRRESRDAGAPTVVGASSSVD